MALASKWIFAIAGLIAALVAILPQRAPAQGASEAAEASIEGVRRQVKQAYYAQCDISLFLAGDTILTVPWSHDDSADFLRLVGEIRAADAAIVNLETLIHEYRGYPQADSGGTYMASPPGIAAELKWAGIDMVGHANNHTFDYGSIGVLENLENLTAAGVLLAGSGPDLEYARAPRYFTSSDGTVALVSMSSTFAPYGKASLSRFDMHGRPGLNPLTVTSDTVVTITPAMAKDLEGAAKFLGFTGERFTYREFSIAGLRFQVGDSFDLSMGLRPIPRDRSANLAAIKDAARNADVVVASLHYHGKGDWLRRFAHEAIDEGADVFLVHGEHRVRGIEIYKDRPIFYGLGDFVFQAELVERLPWEYYDRYGLDEEATPQEAFAARSAKGTRGNKSRPESFEGMAASLCISDGSISEIRLLPVDLHFEAAAPVRGRPYLADSKLGAHIIRDARMASGQFGTRIDFNEAEGFATLGVD